MTAPTLPLGGEKLAIVGAASSTRMAVVGTRLGKARDQPGATAGS
jgi:hypothetical protein